MIKVYLSGQQGFLATKLINHLSGSPSHFFEFTNSPMDCDIYFDLGATTCTMKHFTKEISRKINLEALSKIEIYEKLPKETPIIYGSSSKVYALSDINTQDICKLMLENWIMSTDHNYLILRIETIYSENPDDYKIMKRDRIPSKIFFNSLDREEMSALLNRDGYLEVEDFLTETVSAIEKFIQTNTSKIYEYSNVSKLNLLELRKRILK